MNLLESWHCQGIVEMFKTDVMDTEFECIDTFRNKSKKYREDVGIGVWGHSRWDHCLWGSENDGNEMDEIRGLLFPGQKKLSDRQIRDAMHLHTHIKYKRDYFITSDNHFLSKSEEIKERYGAVVIKPEQLVEILRDKVDEGGDPGAR
ncbi:hypothetical protein A2247_03320 [candidate division WOR-1 bacterium RIFOXYA2_FULL_41_14]|nr:MAG: hypothetical protein A2247_03320 [candidate division WOR-1 bacterium RIFOXYA2_FULL_41_14]